jgi:hypothetical protein
MSESENQKKRNQLVSNWVLSCLRHHEIGRWVHRRGRGRRIAAEAAPRRLLVLLDDEYVEEAVVAQHGAEEPDPALHEGPDLDGVPLLEAAPEDEVEVPSPLTIVPRVLLHRDMSSSSAWKSTSFTRSPPCTIPFFLGFLIFSPGGCSPSAAALRGSVVARLLALDLGAGSRRRLAWRARGQRRIYQWSWGARATLKSS